jgi:hypothetical protein
VYVFHSPHEGHFPIHLGDCAPQLLQKKAVFVFAIAGMLFVGQTVEV